MGLAEDIYEIHADTEYNSSIYVIFYNLGRASHVVNPIANVNLYYERFPFVSFGGTCFRCATEYFAETYGPDSKRRGEYQYVDHSVCEYYPVVIDREDGVLTFGCKQYTLDYKIYGTVIPTLIYHKSYENYVLILAHMISSAYESYLFEELYIRNLLKLGTDYDIVGKVVEEYVNYINYKKKGYVLYISQFLASEVEATGDFHSKLEELRATNTTEMGNLC